jgi:hypothetical protein
MTLPRKASVVNPAALNPFEINRRVLASDLTLAAKAVLLVILDHARHGASKCTATTRTLARESRVTVQHVRRVMLDLEARRLIRVERATGSKHSRHVIFVGPCIHQVEHSVPLRLHEVEHQVPEVEHLAMHEVEHQVRQRTNSRDPEKDGFSPPLEEEDPDVPSGPITESAAEILARLKSVGERYRVPRNRGGS